MTDQAARLQGKTASSDTASTEAVRRAGEPCPKCDGDGYTETWNDKHIGVVITPCTDCGPGPGDFDA